MQHQGPELPPLGPLLKGSIGHTVSKRNGIFQGRAVFSHKAEEFKPVPCRLQSISVAGAANRRSQAAPKLPDFGLHQHCYDYSQFIYGNLTWPWLTPESPGNHKLWVWLPFSPSPPVLILVPNSTPRHGLCQVLSLAAPLTKLCPIHPSPCGLYVPRQQIPGDLLSHGHRELKHTDGPGSSVGEKGHWEKVLGVLLRLHPQI